MWELIVVGVASGLGVLFLRDVFKFVGKLFLGWFTMTLRRTRSWIRGHRQDRYRRRVHKGLDKVSLLASSEEDFKATHPILWPEHTRRRWIDAFVQLKANKVDWPVNYPEHEASVSVRGQQMSVSWGDFGIDGGIDIPNGLSGFHGVPNNEYWDFQRLYGSADEQENS